MVSYRMQLKQQIQNIRQRNGANPPPEVLREIEDMERRIKQKRSRDRRAKKHRKMMQERAEEAEAHADTTIDSPSMDPKMMDLDHELEQLRLTTPEKLRLTTPDPTKPPPEGNEIRGHEGEKGDSSRGVGK